MSRMLTLHSFRGGTGKSNLAANLAWLAAWRGAKVAVIDTDLQSPGIHVILGADTTGMTQTLSDFVRNRCELEDVVVDLTAQHGVGGRGGKLMLLPSSMRLEAITRILADGYDIEHLNGELSGLAERLGLDYVLIDTHPGLNRETTLCAAVSDVLALIVRPDEQDFQGTAVLVEIAKKIAVPEVTLILNKVPEGTDFEGLERKVTEAFGFPVAGALPLDSDLARLGSSGVFVAEFPNHAITRELERIADALFPEHAAKPDEQAQPEDQEVPATEETSS